MSVVDETTPISLREPLVRLARDVRDAAADLSLPDARWLIDEYYTFQDARIRAAGQLKTHSEAGEPHRLVGWVKTTMKTFEAALKRSLGVFAGTYQVGQWLQAQVGIGPVLSAAMLANFDVRKAPTVGHFWRFAGLDPTLKWPGPAAAKAKLKELGIDKTLSQVNTAELSKWSGQHVARINQVWEHGMRAGKKTVRGRAGLERLFAVRPWNHNLKCICLGRLGDCFNKHQAREDCYYGHLLAAKKKELWEANMRGDFSALATQDLKDKNYGKSTEAYSWKSGERRPDDVRACLEAGISPIETPKRPGGIPMLPPQQIYFRARRWAVKLFLSHMHHVMHHDFHGANPPAPFVFAHPENGDHRHLLVPPLWPGEYDGRGLAELFKR